MTHHEKIYISHMQKTVTAKLISIFVLATRIVQFLYFLNTKFPDNEILAIFCAFVSELFGNHIVGILMLLLICVRSSRNLCCCRNEQDYPFISTKFSLYQAFLLSLFKLAGHLLSSPCSLPFPWEKLHSIPVSIRL